MSNLYYGSRYGIDDDSRYQRPGVVAAIAAGAAALVLAIAGWGVYDSHRDLTVTVDGIDRPVASWNPTVAGIASAAGVDLGPYDTVLISQSAESGSRTTRVNSLTERVPNGASMEIYSASTVNLSIAGSDTQIASSAQTVQALLAENNKEGAVISRSQAARAHLPLIEGSSPVRVVETSRTGVRERLVQVPDGDIEAAYEGLGSPLHPLDEVTYSLNADGNLEVSVVRVRREFSTTISPLVFEEVEEETDNLFVGEYTVLSEGATGTHAIREWVQSRGDSPELRVQIHEPEIIDPIDRVLQVGTREATPLALINEGIDPAAPLEVFEDGQGRSVARYRAVLGSLTSAAEIARIQQNGVAGNSQTEGAPVGVYSGEDPRGIAQAMIGSYGWDDRQMSCLLNLWDRESGWNPYAENVSSGAYGIPQALPGSKMASAGSDWRTNPATQISWGLGYISGRYSSPCGAWSFFMANNWY